MSSSNNTGPERRPVPSPSYFFPDFAAPENADAGGDGPGGDFRIAHAREESGGFYSLAQHQQRRENPDGILQAARDRAEAIERQARDDGFARGMEEARAMVEKDLETLFAALNKAMAELETFKKRLERDAEKDAVSLAFAIARKVVYHEIASREETIFEVIHEALKQVPDQKSATLRVSPMDYERLKAGTGAFSAAAASLEEMRMQPDKSIRDGDCIIDTPFGMIDARIEKRLAAVESALKSRLK